MKSLCSFIFAILFIFNASTAFAGKAGETYFQGSFMFTDLEDTNTREGIGGGKDIDYKVGTDTSIAFSGAIGHRFTNNFRGEVEFSHRQVSFDSIEFNNKVTPEFQKTVEMGLKNSSFTAKSLMINGLYDFDFGGLISPYVGVGIGSTWFQGSNTLGSNDADNPEFSYQLMAGVSIQATDKIALVGGYKYLASSDFTKTRTDINTKTNKFENVESSGSFDSHNIELGVRLAF